MYRSSLIALALCGATALPAVADPAIGVGLTLVFGQGQTQTGVGLRVFSTNEEDSAAATIGVDYLFGSGGVRPTLGLAYIGSGVFIGADAGFNLNGGGVSFGLSGGWADSQSPAAASGGGGGGSVPPDEEGTPET